MLLMSQGRDGQKRHVAVLLKAAPAAFVGLRWALELQALLGPLGPIRHITLQ